LQVPRSPEVPVIHANMASRLSTTRRRQANRRQRSRRIGGRTRRGPLNRARFADRARGSLRTFRQATILAVALTAFLLMLFAPEEQAEVQAALMMPQVENQEVPPAGEPDTSPENLARETRETAIDTMRGLYFGFIGSLPRILVALLVFLLAWGIVRVARPVLRRTLGGWERGTALVALFGICVWAAAIGVAMSVLAGDIRALLGSLGLVGLALSWALQTPIESFTGWLMNSFQGYYRVGDRVAVGEVFGDVYRIDFLTTTVWEIGSPERPGFVQAEQPTGRLITFPNSEVLAGSIVNLTRDFPYVWDEISIAVANESDISYAGQIFRGIAHEVLADQMKEPAIEYERILSRQNLPTAAVTPRPEVFFSMTDSWTNVTVRYLVQARTRRLWKSLLVERYLAALNDPAHSLKIIPVYERRQLQLITSKGEPVSWQSE
jgi:small-conductance mechanosensitive channel